MQTYFLMYVFLLQRNDYYERFLFLQQIKFTRVPFFNKYPQWLKMAKKLSSTKCYKIQ